MSIKTWVKGWRLDKFFSHLFKGTESVVNEAAIEKAVLFVERIKTAFYSGEVILLTNLIPGDWDNALVEKIKAGFPLVIDLLARGKVCAAKPTVESKLYCMVEVAFAGNDEERSLFYHNLAIDIARILSDGKISTSDLFILIEIAYRELVKKK